MKKVLLIERTEISPTEELIREFHERKRAGLPVIVTGKIQAADVKNANGRIYPYNILRKETDRYLEEAVKRKVAMGQLDHIDSPIIEMQKVSHIIDDLWWDGPEKKDVMGKIRLLPTPMGQIAEAIVMSGIPLGISSRAIGSVSKNEAQGVDVVSDDLNIVCWDIVGTPSTNEAYLKLHESKDMSKYDAINSLPRDARIIQALNELLKR